MNGGRGGRVALGAAALALVLAAIGLDSPAPADAAIKRPTTRDARQALQSRGYTRVTLRCSRPRRAGRLSCRWRGVPRRDRAVSCSGTAVLQRVRRPRPRTRVQVRRRCRRAQGPARPRIGFNENQSPGSYYLQKAVGARIRRVFVGWNVVEPVPGGFDWTQIDTAYRLMREEGVEPLFVVTAAPCWANAAACPVAVQHPPDAAHYRDWERFVGRLAARYPDIAGVEVWNEPNFLPHFGPRIDPAVLARLVIIAHRAVKAANPDTPVVTGGLFATADSGPVGMADDDYIAGMYAAGIRGSVDAIGYHPYPYSRRGDNGPAFYDPAVIPSGLRRIRQALADAGAGDIPIWVTETGVSTVPQPGGVPEVSEAEQAEGLAAILREIEARRDVPVAIVHRLLDGQHNFLTSSAGSSSSVANEAVNSGFGVFNSDGTPKPAACRLSREWAGFLRC